MIVYKVDYLTVVAKHFGKQMRYILLLIFLITFMNYSWSQHFSISGKIFDSATKKPIPGANIRIENSNRGTYSTRMGFFHLPKVFLNEKIIVSSIGYEKKMIEAMKNTKDTLVIFLSPIPFLLPSIEKVSDIEVDEIIRRAIRIKKDNLAKIKTLQARIYSKMFVELRGPMLERSKHPQLTINNFFGIGTLKDSLEIEFVKNFILETFSNLFADYSKDFKIVEITERRQTSNFPAKANLIAFTEFYNFFEEKLNILNTVFITPLAENALDYYQFKLLGKQLYGDYYVYDIQVEPKTQIFPTFVGTIKIMENTYNLLEIDLQPSELNGIPILDSVFFEQKFNQLNDTIWQPTYFQFSAKLNLRILENLLDFSLTFRATSIVSDAIINQPLPDSIYDKSKRRNLTVSPQADSSIAEFWENNSLREVSKEEIEIYRRIDTISKKIDLPYIIPNALKSKNFYFGLNLFSISGHYNRVVGYSFSFEPFFKYKNYKLKFKPYYSFGQKKSFGAISLEHINGNFASNLSVFSMIDYISIERECSPSLSSILAYLFHWDYYDYYLKDGINIFSEYKTESFAISLGYEKSQHSSLLKTTDKSLFSNTKWRNNPKIEEGSFQHLSFEIDIGSYFASKSFIGNFLVESENKTSFSTRTRLIFGVNRTTNLPFVLFDCSMFLKLPLLYTGYTPISLYFRLDYGKSTKDLPLQFHFRLPVGLLFSAPFGKYGGTEYYSGVLSLILSDICWRWLGLPKFEKRGLELILSIAMGRTFNQSQKSIYETTGKIGYSEIGIGFSKIPTFFSNLIYLTFQSRWGLGPLGKGNWRFNLNIASPF